LPQEVLKKRFPMLNIKNLSLSKQRRKESIQILQKISFDIPKNRISLLLGKSGSGKTSLLRCIAQLEKGHDGEILYKSVGVHQLGAKERCQIIGFVPQSFALFPHLTILDNCAQPLRLLLGAKKRDAYLKVEEVLSSLDMLQFIHARPHELSAGQQQRVAIARALVLNPSFLLFDEPTSALDPENRDLFIAIVQKLSGEGRGVIISTHDMVFAAKILDRALFMEGGLIVETHDIQELGELSSESKLGRFLFSFERPFL